VFSLFLSHTSLLLMNGISNPELDDCVRVTNPTLDKFVVRISFVMGFCRFIYLMVLELIPSSLGDKPSLLYDSIEVMTVLKDNV
jgi:hypothetical protein